MFGGLKGLGDIKGMMEQAQEMQTKAAEMQASLDQIEVQGSAAGGMVVATATAKGTLKGMQIDPSLVNAEEVGVLEDLIVAAVADAQEKASARSQEEMQKLMGGMELPPGLQGMMGQ